MHNIRRPGLMISYWFDWLNHVCGNSYKPLVSSPRVITLPSHMLNANAMSLFFFFFWSCPRRKFLCGCKVLWQSAMYIILWAHVFNLQKRENLLLLPLLRVSALVHWIPATITQLKYQDLIFWNQPEITDSSLDSWASTWWSIMMYYLGRESP